MADFANNSDVARAGRVTGNRDIVTTNNLMKWVAQGKVFESGHGLQTDAMESQAEASLTPDDVKASFALVAPSGSQTLVIPIMFKVMCEVEGGAASDTHLIFTRAAGMCDTTLALSGRDNVVTNCMYAASPVKATPKADVLRGVASTYLLTVSALVDADAVLYDIIAHVDNNVAAPLTGTSQQWGYHFLNEGAPHIMTSGAAMIVYINSASSDVFFHPYVQWAEVELEDLI